MLALMRRYVFATVVIGALAAMALVVVIRTVAVGGPNAQAASPMALGKGGGPGEATLVEAVPVERRAFYDALQALGTAQAKESILITPKITDVIRRIPFESGQRVRRGDILVELTSIEQEADLAEALAQNAAAQEELRRFQRLQERGFASPSRVEAAEAAAGAAEARVAAGRSRVSDRLIRAPFSGVMGLRTASPGQLVRPGDAIGTLDDLSEIKLDFEVPEAQVGLVRMGAQVVARTAAHPGREFAGRVAQIDTRLSENTRSLRVRALLPNPDEVIRPGMLMTVELRSSVREALAVPEPAIVDDAAGAYAYEAAPAERGQFAAARRTVRTGQRVGGYIEILDGLVEGALVIVEGVQRVRPNAPVRLTQTGAERAQGEGAPARP
jgi:membrane fusion protein (multidrug efflux system)